MPPRRFWHVEWEIARRPDRPEDRTTKRRNFTRADDAGAQVRTLRRWIPSHAALNGVWVVVGFDGDELRWEPVDVDSLPVSADVEQRCAALDALDTFVPYP